MKYYAGLDVSLKETSVCIVDQDGNIIKEASIISDPDDLGHFLSDTGLELERVGFESGNLSPWLYHGLKALNFPAIVIESRHAKAAMQAQNVKTDRNDAKGLAHIMRTGWFREVHIKDHESQKLRVLLNNRRCLVDKRVDLDNQIRGTLKVFGLKTGEVSRSAYETRILELIDDEEELNAYILPMLEVRRSLVEQYSKLDRLIMEIVKHDAVCRRLMTIPGVGPLTALSYKTAVEKPERFKKSRDVGAHLGLTPRKYASGEIDYNGRITKCGDAFVRSHLYEAAKVLMSRVSKWSKIKAWGMQVARRSSMKNACVAVARKLAVIMHRMWVDGTEFVWGEDKNTAKAV
jgi:transposase